MWQPRNYKGTIYGDPRDELRARVDSALSEGETHIAVSTSLLTAALDIRECSARTVVNGDRMNKILIEVKCEKMIDPTTGKHDGMHMNGRNHW